MPTTLSPAVAAALSTTDERLLEDWMRSQLGATTMRRDLIDEDALRAESREFLRLLQDVAETNAPQTPSDPAWGSVLGFLNDLSRSRAIRGFSPSETATFVLSFKEPLFERIRNSTTDADEVARELWSATTMLDGLALATTEAYQRAREDVIRRQQQELLELSTPVVKLWDGVLALPLIGTLDSARTQVVMESLLQRIVETSSSIAIIDITGVPTVDTLVAQHLLKTVAAARLMGADCIISGIRPQIAQTIVHLGVDLGDVATKATLADAVSLALERHGFTVVQRDLPGLPD
ncbi:MAG TPA: STAS domain-containing protein [Candidatus Limnocylindrales bacterium]|nr:STAS domain-containing protein [Candidatus Limnocylindrales bacterium]